MDYFPLFLKLNEKRRVLIVGGGAIALAKAEALLPYAEGLRVVSEKFSANTRQFLLEHNIPHEETPYHPHHLDGIGLVIAATDRRATNQAIYEDGQKRGVLVNVVDQTELCDVIFPAIVRRGPLQVAISSSGLSPVLARLVKQQIEKALPWRMDRLIAFAQAGRKRVKEALSTLQARRLFWHDVLEGAVAQEILEGNEEKAETLFSDALKDAQETGSHAALYLIGAGPGDPELLTVKAIRLLSRADVILYDRLVAPEILSSYARKEAEKHCVGKTRDFHLHTQESIDALIEKHLLAGKVVVRLKGGDPLVYAHGAEEIGIARKLGVPYQIVPGITAANGCAAAAGIPLTERGGAQSLRLLTLYKESLADDAYWESLRHAQRETLVFYMATQHRNILCHKLLELGFSPDTPIVAIEQGTTPGHKEYEGTLTTFPERYADHRFLSPTLLIVGDVVRWRSQLGWKEQAATQEPFFPSLAKGMTHVLH